MSKSLSRVMKSITVPAARGGRSRKRSRASMHHLAQDEQKEDDGLGLDFTNLRLKRDHESRPFWVCPNGVIVLEAFSPLYEQARDFLIAICEPKSRPEHLHEYALDENALFAAASMGLTSDIILSALNRLSKVPVPRAVKRFVRQATAGYGKVKLVLHRSRYFVESAYPAVLRYLLAFPDIAAARVKLPASRGGAGGATGSGGGGDGGAFGDFIVGSVTGETGESLGLEGIVGSKKKKQQQQGNSAGPEGYRDAASGGDQAAGDGIVADMVRGEVDTDEEGELEADMLAALAEQAEAEAAGIQGPSAADRAQAVSRLMQSAKRRGIMDDSDSDEDEDEELELEFGTGASYGHVRTKPKQAPKSSAGEDSSTVVSSLAAGSVAGRGGDSHTVRSSALSTAGTVEPAGGPAAPAPTIRLTIGPKGSGASSGHGSASSSSSSAAGAAGYGQPKIKLVLNPGQTGATRGPVQGNKRPSASMRDDEDEEEVEDEEDLPENVAHLIGSSSSEDEAAHESSDDEFDAKQAAMEDGGDDDDEEAIEKNLRGSRSKAAMADSDDDYDGDGQDEDSDILEIDDDAVDEEEEAEIQEALEDLRRGREKAAKKKAQRAKQTKKAGAAVGKRATAKSKAAAAKAGYIGGAKTEEDLARIEEARQAALRAIQASEDERRAGGSGPRQVVSFELHSARVDQVREICLKTRPPFPLMLEYDFKEESSAGKGQGRAGAISAGVPHLAIDLLRPELLRPYQSRSLAKMFGNGRARSGMIVLPCGAGKTFVGIAAAATIKRSCIVLCPNATSVYQWEAQFLKFSKIARSSIMKLTAKDKQPLPPPDRGVLVITTYSMIGMSGRRSEATDAIMRQIAGREWGLMLLDETHQVVAKTFKRVLLLKAHCKLGLTATLVREDGKDKELGHMIGPKLYEANWMDLTRAGYLANVQVVEVWCPMDPAFYREYLRSGSSHRKHALAVMNPNKCLALDALLKVHTSRPGDKVIVFSESVFALYEYAVKFQAPIISGDTPIKDREEYLHAFRSSDVVNVLFLSRVGDVALDVPDANVIIQISSHYGSRLQEAYRMGRILRKGSRQSQSDAGISVGGRELFYSYFYTLISTDTHEVYFSNKRRRYLVDQGYAYKVLKLFPGLGSEPELRRSARFMGNDDERLQVLEDVLSKDVDAQEAKEAKAFDSVTDGLQQQTGDAAIQSALRGGLGAGSLAKSAAGGSASGAVRSAGSMATLSGADGIRYIEYTSEDRAQHARDAAATSGSGTYC